jgi:hypothetical protein
MKKYAAAKRVGPEPASTPLEEALDRLFAAHDRKMLKRRRRQAYHQDDAIPDASSRDLAQHGPLFAAAVRQLH